eukprot:289465-Pelagomonas_calceolata.AAC.1
MILTSMRTFQDAQSRPLRDSFTTKALRWVLSRVVGNRNLRSRSVIQRPLQGVRPGAMSRHNR